MSYQSQHDYPPADPGFQDGQGFDAFEEAEDGGQSGVVLRRAVNIARNRLGWTITFALVLGAAGVAIGLLLWEPRYESRAEFEYQPTLPEVARKTDENQPPQFFGGVIQKQIQILMGPLTRGNALETDAWNELEQEKGHELEFPREVKAQVADQGYTITVIAHADDPQVAATAANALINAYENRYKEETSETKAKLFHRRKEYQRRKEQRLADLDAQKANLTGGTSVSQLEIQYRSHLDQMQHVRGRLSNAKRYLRNMGQAKQDGEGQDQGDRDPMQLQPEQIARNDPQMQEMLDQRRSAKQRLQVQQANGLGEDHPAVKKQARLVDVLQKQIDQRAKDYRTGMLAVGTGTTADAGPGGQPGIGPVKTQADDLAKQYDQLEKTVYDEAKKLADIADLNAKQEQVRADRRQVEQKIEADRVENTASQNRVKIVNAAVPPRTASNTKDQYVFPAGGGIVGMAIGVGIVVLIGLYDHRLQRFADAETDLGEVRILGGLPTLPEDLTEPEQAERTSMAIHHIRTLLQIGRRDRSQTYSVASGSPKEETNSPIIYVGGVPRVYSVTSASPGAGKSSLALALGLSYVTGDSRTLLIDADIIGGGLTRRIFGDENRPQRGLLDGGSSSTRLAELVGRPEGLQGLDFLPIGRARPEDAGVVSLRMVRRIIAQARENYDVVLVDTGPVMGSTEASMFATEADGVIFVLARGDERKTVVRGIDHIRQVGGIVAGIVFNHALTGDLAKSSYGSMMSASRSIPPAQLNGDREQYARFGPIGSAVASYGPLTRATVKA